jgi:hypothetical protein
VLLTTPLESFVVGRTIILSRGLLDVLPDEATLAAVLAHELAHIVLRSLRRPWIIIELQLTFLGSGENPCFFAQAPPYIVGRCSEEDRSRSKRTLGCVEGEAEESGLTATDSHHHNNPPQADEPRRVFIRAKTVMSVIGILQQLVGPKGMILCFYLFNSGHPWLKSAVSLTPKSRRGGSHGLSIAYDSLDSDVCVCWLLIVGRQKLGLAGPGCLCSVSRGSVGISSSHHVHNQATSARETIRPFA